MSEISKINQERSGLVSESFVQSSEMRCPYLGLKDDPLTISGFPDSGNHCHRLQKAVPLAINVQADLCLTDRFETCAIFQKQAIIEETAVTPKPWQKRARPLALIIPLILILIAALVWWPTPGASEQEATTNAAPLQHVVKPEKAVQPAAVQENIHPEEKPQPTQFAPTLAVDAVNIQPEATVESPINQPGDGSRGGFHVRIYD